MMSGFAFKELLVLCWAGAAALLAVVIGGKNRNYPTDRIFLSLVSTAELTEQLLPLGEDGVYAVFAFNFLA